MGEKNVHKGEVESGPRRRALACAGCHATYLMFLCYCSHHRLQKSDAGLVPVVLSIPPGRILTLCAPHAHSLLLVLIAFVPYGVIINSSSSSQLAFRVTSRRSARLIYSVYFHVNVLQHKRAGSGSFLIDHSPDSNSVACRFWFLGAG